MIGLLRLRCMTNPQVFVCRSGSAADTQAISSYVSLYIEQHQMELGRPVDVQTVANLAMQLVYSNKVGCSVWQLHHAACLLFSLSTVLVVLRFAASSADLWRLSRITGHAASGHDHRGMG